MANIDTSTIEGFEGMSDADKVQALLGVEVPDKVDLTGYVKKDVFDKAASEAASYKKQLNEKLSADEKAKIAADESLKSLQDELAALRKENAVTKSTAQYIALGYSEELAKSTAVAMYDGDTETVFKNAKKAQEEMEKKLRTEIMRGNPKPDGASGDDKKDPALDLAKKSGQARAAANKAAADAMKHYL